MLLISRFGETSLSLPAPVNFSSTNIFHTFHMLFTLIISFTNWWLHYLIWVSFVLYFTIKKFNHSVFTNHLNWSEPVCTCLSFSLKGIYLENFFKVFTESKLFGENLSILGNTKCRLIISHLPLYSRRDKGIRTK